jgi:hypothetical protein
MVSYIVLLLMHPSRLHLLSDHLVFQRKIITSDYDINPKCWIRLAASEAHGDVTYASFPPIRSLANASGMYVRQQEVRCLNQEAGKNLQKSEALASKFEPVARFRRDATTTLAVQ